MSHFQQIDFDRLAEIFAALGNPHRLRILAQLAQCCRSGGQCCTDEGELSVGELGGGLEIAASTLSHHVRELSRAGLLCCRKRGKCVLCCADAGMLGQLGALFTALAEGGKPPRALLKETNSK